MTRSKYFAAVLAVGMGLLFSGTASAATKITPGISLSPFQKEVMLDGSTADKSYEVQLRNDTAAVQEIGLSVRDFGSLNETGGVLLNGANSKSYSQKYGLTSWLQLGTNTVVLNPNETRAVPVTIQNRSDLQAGGHYGAIVASVNSLDERTDDRVLINQQLLSLVLVNKTGGEHYDLRLKSVTHNGNWVHLPTTVTLRFQNPGNVHVVPRGMVRLKSPDGRVLKTGIINSESAFVLPETYRELEVPLSTVAHAAPVPGPYHIVVEYRYDGVQQTAKRSVLVQFVSLATYVLIGLLIFAAMIIFRYRKRAHKNTPVTE